MYEKVSTNLNFVEREKKTEQFWKDNDIFRKSMEPNSASARKQSGLLTLVMISEAHFTNQTFLFSSLSWTASSIATRWITSSAIHTTAA